MPRPTSLRRGLVIGLNVVHEHVMSSEAATVQPQHIGVEEAAHQIAIVRGGAVPSYMQIISKSVQSFHLTNQGKSGGKASHDVAYLQLKSSGAKYTFGLHFSVHKNAKK